LGFKIFDLVCSLSYGKTVIRSVLLKVLMNKSLQVQILQQIFDFILHGCRQRRELLESIWRGSDSMILVSR
jgi:hypothetical protein